MLDRAAIVGIAASAAPEVAALDVGPRRRQVGHEVLSGVAAGDRRRRLGVEVAAQDVAAERPGCRRS